MTINSSALSSKFRVPTLAQREQKAHFRRWQAVFFTVRSLLWDNSKGQIFREAKESGVLQPIAPGQRLPDGSYSPEEYEANDIKQLYSEAWEDFTAEFDAGFVNATLEELVEFAHQHFGTALEDLLELNAQRSAVRFSRS